MTKILHIIDSMQRLGGAQEILVSLAKHVDPAKHSQTIARLYGTDRYEQRLSGAPVANFSLAPKKYQLWKILWNLWTHLRTKEYDILHLHLQVSTVFGVLLGRLCGVPKIVVTLYASREQLPFWVYPVFTLLSPWVDVYIGLTRHLLEGFQQGTLATIYKRHLATRFIPIAVNYQEAEESSAPIREELRIAPEDPLLLNVARFHQHKGQDYLLRAMAVVIRTLPNARCLIAGRSTDGTDTELNRLKALACRLQLEQHVFFLENRNDLTNFLDGSDLVVNSTLDEGMGVIICQAMARRKAVAAFNTGSIAEVVIDGETGILVPVKDCEALASAIVTLLSDQELRLQYGEKGKQRIDKFFQLPAIIEQYERVYQELIYDHFSL